MNYSTIKYLMCLSVFSILGYAVDGQMPSNSNPRIAQDRCVPIVTTEDVQILNELSASPAQYISGQVQLNKKQMIALKHLQEESSTCGIKVSSIIQQSDVLLQVMEVLADQNGPIPMIQVQALRQLELDQSGLTPQEKLTLDRIASPPSSPEPSPVGNPGPNTPRIGGPGGPPGSGGPNAPILAGPIDPGLSEIDRIVLKKYIRLAPIPGGLNGFMIPERAALLRIIARNLGNGFSPEDLILLRIVELKNNGLSNRDIEILAYLSNRKDPDAILTKVEIAVLKKWILIESLTFYRDFMNFEELASLHEIIQNQSNPPLSSKELKLDLLAFQKQLKEAPFAEKLELDVLKQIAGNVSDYLGGNQDLNPFQKNSIQHFMILMLEFGRLPGLDPIQVARLLQLVELRAEFQVLMYVLKGVRYIELVKSGFSFSQKNDLDLLRERFDRKEKVSLSKKDVELLKTYIAKGKEVGGLNGFGVQERMALFSIVQNHIQKFTPADLEILRAVEQINNGFSPQEIHQLKMIAKLKKQKIELSAEELSLLDRFEQVERLEGQGSMIDIKEAPRLPEPIIEPPKVVDSAPQGPGQPSNPRFNPPQNVGPAFQPGNNLNNRPQPQPFRSFDNN